MQFGSATAVDCNPFTAAAFYTALPTLFNSVAVTVLRLLLLLLVHS